MKTVEMPQLKDFQDRMVVLPPFWGSHIKKTVIFDMDETLIHCVDDIEVEKPQHVIDIQFEDEVV